MTDDNKDHGRRVGSQEAWPLWTRVFSGAGATFTIILGIYFAVARDFELRHATAPAGSGLKLTGTAAVVAGIGMAAWGIAFLLFVLFPDSPIWRLGSTKRTDSSDA